MTVRVKFKDVSAPYLDELKKEQQAEKKAAAASSYRLSARLAWPRN